MGQACEGAGWAAHAAWQQCVTVRYQEVTSPGPRVSIASEALMRGGINRTHLRQLPRVPVCARVPLGATNVCSSKYAGQAASEQRI